MRTIGLIALFSVVVSAQEEDAPFLGVAVEPHGEGAMITILVEPSSAFRAAFRPGDILVSLDGHPIASREALGKVLVGKRIGDKLKYVVRRGTGTMSGTLTLGKRPGDGESTLHQLEMPVETARPAPRPDKPKAKSDMDQRLDAAEKQIEEVRRRLTARRKAATRREESAPGTLEQHIRRERARLVAARKAHDEQRIHDHEVRLGMLEELVAAGVRVQAPRPDRNRRAQGQRRLDRIERKLDQILKLLKSQE